MPYHPKLLPALHCSASPVAASISRLSLNEHDNRSSSKYAGSVAAPSARVSRRQSVASLHRLGFVAVEEQFAPARLHGRRHHSLQGKGKLSESEGRSKEKGRPTKGSYRVPSGKYRFIRSCSPPCTAEQIVACISKPSAYEHENRSSSKHAGSAFAQRQHDLTGHSLALLPSKNNLFPRALMKDAIAVLHEDDDIQDWIANSPEDLVQPSGGQSHLDSAASSSKWQGQFAGA